MPWREEDFSGGRAAQAARSLPAHRQMAGDGGIVAGEVAGGQHAVRRLLRDNTIGQLAVVPMNVSGFAYPATSGGDGVAPAGELAGGAVTADFGFDTAALRTRNALRDASQRRDEEHEGNERACCYGYPGFILFGRFFAVG